MDQKVLWCLFLFVTYLFIIVQSTSIPLVIPADKSQLTTWFDKNVGSFSSQKPFLDQTLVHAEANVMVVHVAANGNGDFKTIKDAINSVPNGNKRRVIIKIGVGIYKEKITIDRNKPFITLYGDQNKMPTLTFDGTAMEYGTVNSATLIVESDYFVGVNLNIVNSAPRPNGRRVGAQAVAMRISGDKAAFYNCRFHGFQDTLCDDKGKHFFKDCYIEGTVDFIFGSGKSLYLNTELHVISGDPMAVITAQARSNPNQDTGYSFLHSKVTGSGGNAFLGRTWMTCPRVVFAYSDLSNAINPQGWYDNNQHENDRTTYFAEYENKGPGSNLSKRVSYTKELSYAEVKPYISLSFVDGPQWLLPPPEVQ